MDALWKLHEDPEKVKRSCSSWAETPQEALQSRFTTQSADACAQFQAFSSSFNTLKMFITNKNTHSENLFYYSVIGALVASSGLYLTVAVAGLV